ncbi:hypothetical protein pipiens_001604 [Culex pipiens pipiens]|uniref:Glyoxylate reductase/hydroxypyruvate reductase n=1 Tax=Culex pipiens pipiens TaxID=38569 RepID=A0ABD1CH33_CULPP
MRFTLLRMAKPILSLEAAVRETRFPATYRPRLLVTCSDVPASYIDPLRNKCDVTVCEGVDRDEILQGVPGAGGILWLTADRLDGGSAGAGWAAAAGGFDDDVVNNPVADIAVGLMLAAARRFHEGRVAILEERWEQRPQWMLGQDVAGATVGIVGFGGIGQTIAKRLRGFDVGRLIYTGHGEKVEAKEFGASFVGFDELLRKSDFVFVVCPLTSETKNLFNAEAFKKMKPTSVLVNVARGGIVDQPALIEALRNGTIFAAGLDVMTPEPLPPNDPLMTLPNCIVVPHLGTATRQSLEDMFCITARNVLSVLAGGTLVAPFKK